mgnify:CR=1 FL=1
MRLKTRESFGLTEQEVAFVSVGELIPRKNHSEVIKVLASIVQERENLQLRPFHYYICGQGDLREELEQLIKKEKMENYITLLGYQEDARIVLFGMDAFLFPSLQEGLPVALMEAMACKLPCLVSNIRGNVDLIDKEKGGLLFNPNDIDEIASKIMSIVKITDKWGKYNEMKIKEFDIKNVQKIMRRKRC